MTGDDSEKLHFFARHLSFSKLARGPKYLPGAELCAGCCKGGTPSVGLAFSGEANKQQKRDDYHQGKEGRLRKMRAIAGRRGVVLLSTECSGGSREAAAQPRPEGGADTTFPSPGEE